MSKGRPLKFPDSMRFLFYGGIFEADLLWKYNRTKMTKPQKWKLLEDMMSLVACHLGLIGESNGR